eukprot:TRINITY_DN8397_c0_g1_i1.p1 TRINITY_DN8397_c0_g1~~TRINITY_DN8397_c0_g1_i1.p1  ORF type:complete len:181 (-),score=35.44 TRINITY_DN8397_c0_g1_i1:193-735(-)
MAMAALFPLKMGYSSSCQPLFSGNNPLQKGNLSSGFTRSKSLRKNRKIPPRSCQVFCMQVWSPVANRKYETLSYLPPLTEESVLKQVDYIVSKGWIPCLEFDTKGQIHRENGKIPGYYDGRYWTLWKLPMFGCTDSAQVMREINECKKTYPNAYIRCLGFDNKKQTQCIAFVVHKPSPSA